MPEDVQNVSVWDFNDAAQYKWPKDIVEMHFLNRVLVSVGKREKRKGKYRVVRYTV